jgi:diguanylate cyclase (GGDEF)-like protein/PAS domain S-box-containing protein
MIGSRSATPLPAGKLLQRLGEWLRRSLPAGRGLPYELWLPRHRVMGAVLWLHVVGLPVYGVLRGYSIPHCLQDTAPLAAMWLAAMQPRGGRTFRSVMSALGLMMAAALLVHFSGGVIEAHFHFFVMVALLSLYQDWIPFLIALAFVVIQHGVMGVLFPATVYDHLDAFEHPWRWAFIHGGFVLAAAAANVYVWRTSEEDHRRSRTEVQRSEAAFRALFERNPQPMWVYDLETLAFLAVNDAAIACYGYSREEFLTMRIADIRTLAEGQRLLRHMAAEDLSPGTWEHRAKDGRIVHAEVHSQPLEFHGREARLVVVVDLTTRVTLESELRHRAFHDVLTGLANRALFNSRLEQVRSDRRQNGRIAVLTLDVDGFKAVNDSHGHGAGDAVLVEVAARLVAAVRSVDLPARMGGDEFAVLLEGAGPTEAREVADRLLDAIRRPIRVGPAEVWITASIGVAVDEGGVLSSDDLLRHADIATYEAKADGKNRARIFQPGMQSGVLHRLEMAADLRRALERSELHLEYQPIVHLPTGAIRGVEALARWRHPVHGAIGPADFIPVAEETGLIVPIGAWVLEEACRQVATWQAPLAGDRRIALSVNVSSRELREADFVASVLRVVAATGFDPAQLVLEVTETSLIDDLSEARRRLEQLREAGVRVAVDDFGSGYSSLGYLRRLPLDAVKIDRMFVAGLSASEQGRELALAVVRLVDTLDLPTIAEGIETAEELEYVRSLGVDYGQGYCFSHPLEAAAAASVVAGPGYDMDVLAPGRRGGGASSTALPVAEPPTRSARPRRLAQRPARPAGLPRPAPSL